MDEYLREKTNWESIEELADLLEVIYALTECHDSSREELERVRAKKEHERGGFRDKIFLEGISD
jgi:predicted house-cleaning noncanonical NTP pyrophosphatase (MazG superfamily)